MLKVNRDLTALHPELADVVSGLLKYLEHAEETGKTKTRFKLYEGYRSPQRQQYLFSNTRSTKAKPWQSAHNFGLAVDIVAVDGDTSTGWSWDEKHDWEFMRAAARDFGLNTPIAWDLVHLEHPLFNAIRNKLPDLIKGPSFAS